MKEEAVLLWKRANKTLASAKMILSSDPDQSASSSYYAAFQALSALFLLQEKTYYRHAAIQAALHRDLIKPGLWTKELGEKYSNLIEMRNIGDYGVTEHVSAENAAAAIESAQSVLDAVHAYDPSVFTL